MTRNPKTRTRPIRTSNLEDPDALKPYAKCSSCGEAYYDKRDALEIYLRFHCDCGAFMDMSSFTLEFIQCVNRLWKGGDL